MLMDGKSNSVDYSQADFGFWRMSCAFRGFSFPWLSLERSAVPFSLLASPNFAFVFLANAAVGASAGWGFRPAWDQ